MRPPAVTASFEPRGRGALRRVATTVAIATSSPAPRHSSAFASTSSTVAMMPAMGESEEADLDALLARVDRGELGDPLPVLAYVAGLSVTVDGAELNAITEVSTNGR